MLAPSVTVRNRATQATQQPDAASINSDTNPSITTVGVNVSCIAPNKRPGQPGLPDLHAQISGAQAPAPRPCRRRYTVSPDLSFASRRAISCNSVTRIRLPEAPRSGDQRNRATVNVDLARCPTAALSTRPAPAQQRLRWLRSDPDRSGSSRHAPDSAELGTGPMPMMVGSTPAEGISLDVRQRFQAQRAAAFCADIMITAAGTRH